MSDEARRLLERIRERAEQHRLGQTIVESADFQLNEIESEARAYLAQPITTCKEGELVAALGKQESCGKCRLHGLVFADAKRHLQRLLAWVPDNDARREAVRFLRMSERQVRALGKKP